MNLKGMVDKARNWARQNPEKAGSYVDKATNAVKGRVPGRSEQIDGFGDRAKNYLRGDAGGGQPGPQQPGPQQPGPQQPGTQQPGAQQPGGPPAGEQRPGHPRSAEQPPSDGPPPR